jgi:enoyl-CoA hydratase/carnithine racemase
MAVVLYEKKDRIAYITLNRPEAFHSINPELQKELSEVLTDFRQDDSLWVAIITGSGEKAFCAGADIKTMIPFLKETRRESWRQSPTTMRGLEVWKPLIAAVNGVALGGGCELALSCDIRIAAENARFGVPEVTLGIIPGWGGTQRLPRLIPQAVAAEMLMTGAPISAQEAYRVGLVNKVVPLAELMPAAEEMAERLCRPGPLAVRAAKEAMIRGSEMTLEEGLMLETKLFASVVDTEDADEGVKAFGEKRKPSFEGK